MRTPTTSRESRHDGRRSRLAGTRTSLTPPLPASGPVSTPAGTYPADAGSSWQIAHVSRGAVEQPVDNLGATRAACQTERVPPRFYLLADVAELLNVSAVQARALVTSGELPAIQVGGRGQWRVEASELEAYIQRMYEQTRNRIEERKRVAAGDPGSTAPDDE
jgi:excisionase family DNA binding protein